MTGPGSETTGTAVDQRIQKDSKWKLPCRFKTLSASCQRRNEGSQGVKPCNRRLREGMKSAFLEICKTQHDPEHPTTPDPALSKGYLVSRASFQPH